MVVRTSSVSKPSKLSIASKLDIALYSSMTPTTKEVPFARHGARNTEEEDDTESFHEDDLLFMEGGDGDDDGEGENGTFFHYAWTGIPSSSPRLSPHSVNVLQNRTNYQLEHGKTNDAENSHITDHHTSPCEIVTASRKKAFSNTERRGSRRSSSTLSVRESLLAEAWERKRVLMLQEEMVSMKERAKPELLGRSSSDCRKLVKDVSGSMEMRRSMTRSLTDHDFEELRGCIDLGFRFDQSAVPDLCDTIPALEVFCAVSQSVQELPSRGSVASPVLLSPVRCSSPLPSPSWRVSSPGDDPEEVKGRLRHWAQAVACNARHCY